MYTQRALWTAPEPRTALAARAPRALSLVLVYKRADREIKASTEKAASSVTVMLMGVWGCCFNMLGSRKHEGYTLHYKG